MTVTGKIHQVEMQTTTKKTVSAETHGYSSAFRWSVYDWFPSVAAAAVSLIVVGVLLVVAALYPARRTSARTTTRWPCAAELARVRLSRRGVAAS